MSDCPVCFESLDQTIRTSTPCGHEVCLACLLKIVPRRCVICRADLAVYFHKPSVTTMEHSSVSPLSSLTITRLRTTPPLTREYIERLLVLDRRRSSRDPRFIMSSPTVFPEQVTYTDDDVRFVRNTG